MEKELASLKEKSGGMKAEWQKEKSEIDAQAKVKEELETARTDLERAQRRGELGKASEIQYGRIPELEKNWTRLRRKKQARRSRGSCARK